MIYRILTYGNTELFDPAKHVRTFNLSLETLVEDMFSTMYAYSGVGLAAPQIGIRKRIAVVDVSFGKKEEEKLVLINPEVLSFSGNSTAEEGCLSLPGFRGPVSRPKTVTIRAQGINGEWFERTAEGYKAQAIQHEIDHLNGILYIDHLTPLRRDIIKRRVKKLVKREAW